MENTASSEANAIEGISCPHPDLKNKFNAIYQVRENIFSKKDPICSECLKCNCLAIFMKPIEERATIIVPALYDPKSYLCQNCHIREECFANIILKKPVGGWVEDYDTNIRGIGGGETGL